LIQLLRDEKITILNPRRNKYETTKTSRRSNFLEHIHLRKADAISFGFLMKPYAQSHYTNWKSVDANKRFLLESIQNTKGSQMSKFRLNYPIRILR
jgi:hypothetical protein